MAAESPQEIVRVDLRNLGQVLNDADRAFLYMPGSEVDWESLKQTWSTARPERLTANSMPHHPHSRVTDLTLGTITTTDPNHRDVTWWCLTLHTPTHRVDVVFDVEQSQPRHLVTALLPPLGPWAREVTNVTGGERDPAATSRGWALWDRVARWATTLQPADQAEPAAPWQWATQWQWSALIDLYSGLIGQTPDVTWHGEIHPAEPPAPGTWVPGSSGQAELVMTDDLHQAWATWLPHAQDRKQVPSAHTHPATWLALAWEGMSTGHRPERYRGWYALQQDPNARLTSPDTRVLDEAGHDPYVVRDLLDTARDAVSHDPTHPRSQTIALKIASRHTVLAYLSTVTPDRAALVAAAGLSVDDPVALTATDEDLRFLAALRATG